MTEDERKHEQFQYWLASMDEAIDAFVDGLPESTRSALDLTPASLNALEAVVLDKYATLAQAKAPQSATFVDGAARYFGEVLRKGTGAKWELRTNDKKFVFYGLPILVGGMVAAAPVCPLTTITSCVDRRRGTFLKGIYDNLTTA